MERNILVDKLKGYACFLVLFGHVIMGIRLAGINIPSFFRDVEEFVWSFHVALFLFLSGVVYKETGEWKSKKSRGKFIFYKLLNLGVPYVFFSTVYILINSFVASTNTNSSLSDVLNIWKTPVAQYWYLYALFFLFCIWCIFSKLLNNWQITVIIVFLGYALPYLGISLDFFDIVFSSALAFGIGTFVEFKRTTHISFGMKWFSVFLHLFIGAALAYFGIIEKPILKELMIIFGIFASIQFIDMIQEVKIISKVLMFLNRYSFQIYLLHTIFTAGIRIILLRINITQWYIHVIIGICCGLLFSVLSALFAKKAKILDFVFFPSKTIKCLKQKM